MNEVQAPAELWLKIRNGEYTRTDGVVIRKNTRMSSAWWEIFLPTGDRPQLPAFSQGRFLNLPAAAPSLRLAQEFAEEITVSSPVYKVVPA